MNRLGIEFISVFGMPPVDFIELAAAVGAPHISLGLNAMDYNPHGYPQYSIAEDAGLRREIRAALADNAVELSLGENLPVMIERNDTEAWKAGLRIFEDLGVRRINSVSFETDLARNVDQYGRLSETAAEFGIDVLIEFVPIFGIADLSAALAVTRQVNRPNLALIMDTMHLGRTGVTPDQLRSVPAASIGYIQLCDIPRVSQLDYMDEAMHERQVPGEGELPLAEYLAAMPQDRIVSLEVPQRSLADAGIGPRERLEKCVAAARTLLTEEA